MSDKHTIDDLTGIVFDLQKSVRTLERENAILGGRVSELEQENQELRTLVSDLERENEELRRKLSGGGNNKGVKSPPKWAKANTPEQPKKERKKRGQAFFRRRQTPTRVVEHAHDTCPDCGRALSGGTTHHSRQVIDIPPASVEVVEHRYISRHCGVCKKNYAPKVDLKGEVVGTHRIGIRLMSLISYLTITARVPKRTICKLLKSLYGVEIGYGEINKILSTVAKECETEPWKDTKCDKKPPVDTCGRNRMARERKERIHLESIDSWDAILRLGQKPRRSGRKDLIGSDYDGTVVSDFYCGYDPLLCRHQRCWVHFLRDVRKLKEDHQKDADVLAWAKKVKRVYTAAKKASGKESKDRVKLRQRFEKALLRLAEPYVKADVPQRVLAKRIVRYVHEMFVFVEDPRIPSENNAAERAVRPAVIARKVCGGSRSGNGTETKMRLMSLLGTWLAQGLDGIESCRLLLAGQSVLFPEPI